MRNPTRRNRNIGTAKSGRSQDNRLVIPSSWHDSRVFWERLQRPIVLDRYVGRRHIRFAIEAPRPGSLYGATPNDIVTALGWLPPEDLDELTLITLRQPTRKQSVLRPVWGRFMYFAEPAPGCFGPGICLEALPLEPIAWPLSRTPERERELRRLANDGHRIERDKRAIRIHVTAHSLRTTVLYRTLLHEVGHLVDWCRSELRPLDDVEPDSVQAERIRAAFASKTSAMKEDFAHRYAEEAAEHARARGLLPFDTTESDEALRAEGLDPTWFVRQRS